MNGDAYLAMLDRKQSYSELMAGRWNEVEKPDGSPRPAYKKLKQKLQEYSRSELKSLEDSVEATLREMGVSFDVDHTRPWGSNPWECDIFPQVFTTAEWRTIQQGIAQRMRAFDIFLSDIYGGKLILREGVIPTPPVLGSNYYELPAWGIRPIGGHHLHLSGICLTRLPDGRLAVKNHYFAHASGISYMLQNRRALIRVNPDLFSHMPIELIADTPLIILDMLRELASGFDSEPTCVLLTPGTGSAAYSEHSLLARRMGIPLVTGDDLMILSDFVYLKTISGLQRVEAIYSRLADPWIDPLVFRSDSLLGVPGLAHCIRKGTVAFINSLGSQLADDRVLLCFDDRLIRYYLNEKPLLPTLPTYWMGDIDQRNMVMESLDDYVIRPSYGEAMLGRTTQKHLTGPAKRRVAETISERPGYYVAQRWNADATATCYINGQQAAAVQDHIFFALKQGDNVQVFPGALTRTAKSGTVHTASELGGASKDTWIMRATRGAQSKRFRMPKIYDHALPAHQITSRIAEGFYWMGRYLERAYSSSYLISTVETLETEELNNTERELYRPMWNLLLSSDGASGIKQRNISTWGSRYRLAAQDNLQGSVAFTVRQVLTNADSLQDLLSTEAWSVLTLLRTRIRNSVYRKGRSRNEAKRMTARITDACTRLIPEFLGNARISMLHDEGWRFCEIGVLIERAINTAHAVLQTSSSLISQIPGRNQSHHTAEIELSALLRFLGSRDAYRRVYQMRAAPSEVLDILWQNDESPRSVSRCLGEAAYHLSHCLPAHSQGAKDSAETFNRFRDQMQAINWDYFFKVPNPAKATFEESLWLHQFPGLPRRRRAALVTLLQTLYEMTVHTHEIISDHMLSHQAEIRKSAQPLLTGFPSDAL